MNGELIEHNLNRAENSPDGVDGWPLLFFMKMYIKILKQMCIIQQ